MQEVLLTRRFNVESLVFFNYVGTNERQEIFTSLSTLEFFLYSLSWHVHIKICNPQCETRRN